MQIAYIYAWHPFFVVASDGTPYILMNNGNKNLAEPQYLPLGDLASFKSGAQFALEDLNNDGYLDIISSQNDVNDLLTPGTEGLYVWYMGANGAMVR
ncbi:MAG: VCBS repeat-containing protein [Paludibacteraceae bacterium]|nr:VCBS repeat-containing protein [Paludibacteraceae bacterium]